MNQKPLTKSINPARHSPNRPFRRWRFLVAGLVLTWLMPASQARAQCSQMCNDGLLDTALGTGALSSDTGGANTAMGFDALYSNTTGGANTASGKAALYSNTIGYDNTATGWDSLVYNTVGYFNTATGAGALYGNQSGNSNTATGSDALNYNYTGDNNTAIGSSALYVNSTGSNNTAVGAGAGGNSTGSNNTVLGYNAGSNLTTGSNNIDIENDGVAAESGTIRIGTAGTQTTAFIAGIRGVPVASAQAVGIGPTGQLGIRASSARFKEAIRPMGKASEAILALKPVSFRYKKALDPKGTPEFGLIAEEVAKIDPDLVANDEGGKPFTVRYDEVNAMLLNEFLKEHRKVEKQQITIADLKAKVDTQVVLLAQQQKVFQSAITKQQEKIQALTATLQKVSNEVEMMKTSPRIVANNQ